ncbi:hypothetical protein M153_13020002985 [Pseudoloma neurophilia]|uniref:Uncharacterized protein n=1 Tax=Pseudoloma neurophilia TaxID=146866 RepID=A0A0R0LUX8_9MICR|nr:hypothetical protein M153_13020002985 [Pseudoloma neurophilia]
MFFNLVFFDLLPEQTGPCQNILLFEIFASKQRITQIKNVNTNWYSS